MKESWRLLPYHRGSAHVHFARSDALVRHATVPTLWWHSSTRPVLLLGPAQTSNDYDEDACRSRGISIVRRSAGGTAVLAGPGVLGLDVILPLQHPLAEPDVVRSYQWLGSVWVVALQLLRVEARLVTIEEARRAAATDDSFQRMPGACFGSLSPYEVVVENRKLVGLAQVRRRSNLALHAAIHLHFDAAGLSSLLARVEPERTRAALERSAAGLNDVSPIPRSEAEVIDAFEMSLATELGVELVTGEWSHSELGHPGVEGYPAETG